MSLQNSLPKHIKLVEVGPRDGLQNEANPIASTDKIAFVKSLADAGLTDIEATAFVHPKAVPQLADAMDVMAGLSDLNARADITLSALAPNLRGLERAREAGLKRIAVFTAASNTFTQNNIRMSVDESLATFGEVAKEAKALGMSVRGYVSTVFVCPYEGAITPEQVLPVTEALFNMGCDEVSLGDTIGAAVPTDIETTIGYLLEKNPSWKNTLALHCHDTYGTALANIVAGLQLGLTTIDSSAGGLGGCPYAPGASGNVATEDVIYLCEKMGITTGVDAKKVVHAAQALVPTLGRPLNSKNAARLLNAKQPAACSVQ